MKAVKQGNRFQSCLYPLDVWNNGWARKRDKADDGHGSHYLLESNPILF